MAFLYEQKFATLLVLFLRFFDRRRSIDEALPNRLWVTRQRLAVLRQAGFIASQRVYTQAQGLYLLTPRGYEMLRCNRQVMLDKEPVRVVDFRYFEHDRRVTLCRVALERQGKCLKWHSDRYLRLKRGFPLDSGKFFKLPDTVIADGVFVSSKNERVAFELEHTPKKRERYEDKRFHYLKLLEGSDSSLSGGVPALQRVLLVASTDRIGKDLQEYFGIHPRFQILSFESLVGGCLGKEALS